MATDVVVFTIEEQKLKVLLIKRLREPFKNCWALPGGFLLKDEPPQSAARRVLKNKAGIKNVYTEQLYTFPGSGRDPRGNIISIVYFALAAPEKIRMVASGDTQTPTLWAVKKLPKLAFDHQRITAYALQRLRAKLEYTNAVYALLPMLFTFNQLQKTYEIISDCRLDKRNFRKKFMLLGLIKPTARFLKGVHQRPARLYQFISRQPVAINKFF